MYASMIFISSRRYFRRTEWGWLVLALFLHSLLFLIPYTPNDGSHVAPKVVNVKLTPFLSPIAAPAPYRLKTEQKRLPVDADLEEIPQPEIIAEMDELVVKTQDSNKEIKSTRPASAAEIFQLVQESNLDSSVPEVSRQLGKSQKASPAKANGEDLFSTPDHLDGMYAPAEVEITDLWLAADGSHNVVVNLPNGDTVCGRALPWNPMQPLVEHVMLFRSCGGGGKRSFNMDSPYSHRDVITNP
jgi:hypothetical protein